MTNPRVSKEPKINRAEAPGQSIRKSDKGYSWPYLLRRSQLWINPQLAMKNNRIIPIKIKSSISRLLLAFRGNKNCFLFYILIPRGSFRSQKGPVNYQEKVNFAGARPVAARKQSNKLISAIIYDNFTLS
jgi:hypothetical protein